MAVKNNLKKQLDWLMQSNANIPSTNPIDELARITVPSLASNNKSYSSRLSPPSPEYIQQGFSSQTKANDNYYHNEKNQEIANTMASQIPDMNSFVFNVEKSQRMAGLRSTKKELQTSRSNTAAQSISMTNGNDLTRIRESTHGPVNVSSTQPSKSHQSTTNNFRDRIPVRNTDPMEEDFIDLTMDDEPSVPKKRPVSGNEDLKRQKINRSTITKKSLNPHSLIGTSNPTTISDPGKKKAMHQVEDDPFESDDELDQIALAHITRNPTQTLTPNLSKDICSSQEDLLKLQQEYINTCERRIDLLVKRIAIEESTALSEDAKRSKRAGMSSELVSLEKLQMIAKSKITSFQNFPVLKRLPSVIHVPESCPKESISSASVVPPTPPPQLEVFGNESLDLHISDNEYKDPLPSKRKTTRPQNYYDDNNYIIKAAEEDKEEMDEEEFYEGEKSMDGLISSQPELYDEEAKEELASFVEFEYEDEIPDFTYKPSNVFESDYEFESDVEYQDTRESVETQPNEQDLEDYEDNDNDENFELRDSTFNKTPLKSHTIQKPVPTGRSKAPQQLVISDDDDDDDDEDDFIMDGSTLSNRFLNDTVIRSLDNQNQTELPDIVEIADEDENNSGNTFSFEEDDEDFGEERELVSSQQSIQIVDEKDYENATQFKPVKIERIEIDDDLPNAIFPSDDEFDDELDRFLQARAATGEKHAWTKEVFAKLNSVFKLNSFRQNQLEAVNATLCGKDTFVLMPTGGGKSLCYQLPAIVESGKTRGTTIVISPLISLMQDQVEHLMEKNIPACMISSKGSPEEKRTNFHLFINGFLSLVYLSPEMISASSQAKNAIAKLHREGNLARIVIDEAHCMSSWGHDFRPDYKALSYFKNNYPDIPVMALTATANDQVKMDIIHNLNLQEPVFLKQSFNRTNLFYEVLPKDKYVMLNIERTINSKFRDQTGIIYCHSKQSCEQTSEKLNNAGVKCAFYHAGMEPDDRLTIQKAWQSGEIKVICATIAFGMGIDKPDVRFVMHLTLPRTLEGYYQETGRAGRDGEYSYCMMYYSLRDAKTLQNMISRDKDLDREGKEKHQTKLTQVVQYCENNTDCRRQQVLQYFNETFDKALCEKNCDNCKRDGDTTLVEKDVTDQAILMTQLVKSIQNEKVTLIYCQDIFRGSKSNKIVTAGHDTLPQHGGGKDLERGDLQRIAFHLISEKILEEYAIFNKAGFATSYVRLSANASKLLNRKKKIIMSFSHQNRKAKTAPKNSYAADQSNHSSSTEFQTPNNQKETTNRNSSRASTVSNVSKKTTPVRRDTSNLITPSRLLTTEERLNEFAFSSTPRIISAKSHLQRTSSGIKEPVLASKKTSPTAVVLTERKFSSEEEKINFVRAYEVLKTTINDIMTKLSFTNGASVMPDKTLKEMAMKLPQSDADFRQLSGFIGGSQAGYFKFFRETLKKLYEERHKPKKKAITTSRFFQGEQQERNAEIIQTIRASQKQTDPMAVINQKQMTTSQKTGFKRRYGYKKGSTRRR